MQLRGQEHRLAEILELGLREFQADRQAGFEGASEVFELLASLPTPEEILALRPSPRFSARVAHLLNKNRELGRTADEQAEWQRYEYLEHLVRLAKAKALRRMRESTERGGH